MGNCHRESLPQNNQHRAPGGGRALTGTRNRDLMEGTWEAVARTRPGATGPRCACPAAPSVWDRSPRGSPCGAAAWTVCPESVALRLSCPWWCAPWRGSTVQVAAATCPFCQLPRVVPGVPGQGRQGIHACVLVLEALLRCLTHRDCTAWCQAWTTGASDDLPRLADPCWEAGRAGGLSETSRSLRRSRGAARPPEILLIARLGSQRAGQAPGHRRARMAQDTLSDFPTPTQHGLPLQAQVPRRAARGSPLLRHLPLLSCQTRVIFPVVSITLRN